MHVSIGPFRKIGGSPMYDAVSSHLYFPRFHGMLLCDCMCLCACGLGQAGYHECLPFAPEVMKPQSDGYFFICERRNGEVWKSLKRVERIECDLNGYKA